MMNISRRDYFAAMALQGCLANSGVAYECPNELVEDAVDFADRLIAKLDLSSRIPTETIPFQYRGRADGEQDAD